MARFLRKFIHHEARTGSTLQSFLQAQQPDLDTISLLLRHLTTVHLGDKKTPHRIMDVAWYLQDRGDTLLARQQVGHESVTPSPTALAHVALAMAAVVNYDIPKRDMQSIRAVVVACATRGLALSASRKDLPLISTAMYRTEVRDVELWRKVITRAVELLGEQRPSDRLDPRGLVGVVFGLSKMAINAPLLERHLPRADELSSLQARAQLLYVRCRMQRKAGCADLDPDIEALASSLAREAADRESFLLALHAISLVPYRHEGLLSRGVEGEDCEGDRGWTAGSYLRYIADCFRLSCPVTSTTSIVSNAITYESFFLYGLRFMGWDLSRARVPNLGEAISTVNSRVLPAESAAMLLAAFQMSYWSSSKRLRNLANISLESLRKLQHCTQFEVNETAPHARYQVEVDEVLRAVSSSDFRVLREVEVDPYSLDLLLITPQFLRTMQADISVNL